MREYVRFSKHRIVHRIVGECLDLLEMTLITVFCVILLFTYVLHVATVQGSSMEPTLIHEDKLLVLQLHGAPDYGDIVIIDSQQAALLDEQNQICLSSGLGKSIVKRVIAVGGQELNIDFEAGVVTVDGEVLEEPYINALTTVPKNSGAFTYPLTIPEGYLFVMGDNRGVSKDSRYPDVGLIDEDTVEGKVLMRLYPFSKFGIVQ